MSALTRLHQRSLIRAKIIQKFPDIFIEPSVGELIRLLKLGDKASCRGIIEQATGLIIFDSSKLTHAQAAHVLETEHGIELPKNLSPEHQLTFVSSPVLDYKRVYIFTSKQAYKNPIEDLKKYSRAWTLLSKQLSPVYVEYKHYDDARYYLETDQNRKDLVDHLKFLEQ